MEVRRLMPRNFTISITTQVSEGVWYHWIDKQNEYENAGYSTRRGSGKTKLNKQANKTKVKDFKTSSAFLYISYKVSVDLNLIGSSGIAFHSKPEG